MSQLKKHKLKLSYALWRCCIEVSFLPLFNHAEKEWRAAWCAAKIMVKKATGMLILFLIISLIVGKKAHSYLHKTRDDSYKAGWQASQYAMGDSMQRELTPLSKSERERKYREYLQTYEAKQGGLAQCAINAFRCDDWDWTITFMEQSKRYISKEDDRSLEESPFYIGALILSYKSPEDALKDLNDYIDRQIQIRETSGQLSGFLISLGAIVDKCVEVGEKLPPEKKHYMQNEQKRIGAKIEEVKKLAGK